MIPALLKMTIATLGVAATASLVGCAAQRQPTTDPDVVSTANGPVQGVREPDRVVFKGIPYAAPPVGALRWQPPQPAANWTGIRQASSYGNNCYQTRDYPGATGKSEDCLYLNVYKPANATITSRLPVHVWVHGGGFAVGTGAEPRFDNPGDVKAGIVYVNFNYRLNAFGFFAHPGLTRESPNHASGNYGLMDQIAALKWVQQNIAQFGGDPGQVTVSGESAGAASIGYLIQSSLAKGLFKRAILQSTFGFHPQRTLAEQEQLMVSRYGADIATLRAKPAAEILAVLGNGGGIETTAGIFGFQDFVPNVDGHVLKKSDRQAWKDGDFATVDMMIGDNENEGALFMSFGGKALAPGDRTVPKFRDFLRTQYGDLGAKAISLYPVNADVDVEYQLGLAYGDSWFQNASREMSRYMVRRTPNVYRYVFSKHAPSSRRVNGRPTATHVDEIAYLFGNIVVGEKYTASDMDLSLIMQDAKRRFIKTGNPNGGARMPAWPRYDATDPFMEFGDSGPIAGSGRRNAQLDLVKEFLDKNIPLR